MTKKDQLKKDLERIERNLDDIAYGRKPTLGVVFKNHFGGRTWLQVGAYPREITLVSETANDLVEIISTTYKTAVKESFDHVLATFGLRIIDAASEVP